MALEDGAEVAAKDGPTNLDRMGPINLHSLGGLGVLTTLQTGAVGHTGDGALVHTTAATQPRVPGRNEPSLDLPSNNHKTSHNSKLKIRTGHPDNWVGSKKTGMKR